MTLAVFSNLLGRDGLVILGLILLLSFGARKLPALVRAFRRIPAAFREGLRDGEKASKSNKDDSSNLPRP